MAYEITSQKDVREAFWEAYPELERKGKQKQNEYPTDTRVRFCEYVDGLCRAGGDQPGSGGEGHTMSIKSNMGGF